jgi:hypothetical protein
MEMFIVGKEPPVSLKLSNHAAIPCNLHQKSQVVRQTILKARQDKHLCRTDLVSCLGLGILLRIRRLIQYRQASQPMQLLFSRRRKTPTHHVMSPLEFMQRLAALVPRPRLHLIRFHGVLANEKILNHLGLDPQPPPRAPARGQMAFGSVKSKKTSQPLNSSATIKSDAHFVRQNDGRGRKKGF